MVSRGPLRGRRGVKGWGWGREGKGEVGEIAPWLLGIDTPDSKTTPAVDSRPSQAPTRRVHGVHLTT